MLARYWNLGPFLEVANCESVAIIRALELAIVATSNSTTTTNQLQDIYIFIDSQAAISRLQGGYNPLACKARALLAKLAALRVRTYIH